jgi:hypothetical protein
MSSVARTDMEESMFEKVIEKVFLDDSRRSYQRHNNVHWPSEASIVYNGGIVGSCLREKYFQRTGVPVDKPMSVENIRKMKIGKMIEQSEIEAGKIAGIWVADDIGFQFTDDNITVSGKLDAIYLDENGNNVCIEYKTSSGWNFIKGVFGGTGSNSKRWAVPKLEHVLQTMLYLHAKPELAYGIIFYINRESMATIEHKIELREGKLYINGRLYNITIGMIVDRYKLLTTYLEGAMVPPRDYVQEYKEEHLETLYSNKVVSKFEYERWQSSGELPGDIRCSWCQWGPTCKGMGCAEPDKEPVPEEKIEEALGEEDAPFLLF